VVKSKKIHFLITAGGTREYIDPVRFISNASSGKTGYALAQAAVRAGHKATLITTIKNSEFGIRNPGWKTIAVETAGQMFHAVKRHFRRCDCLIMAAAVADYTPVKKSEVKIKKVNKRNLTIRLKPTIDILAWAGKHKKKNQYIAGFALEDKNPLANAEKKLAAKNLDMIIVNAPESIGADRTTVQIKAPGHGWLKPPEAKKSALARRIVKIIEADFARMCD
jgi:phosphopantothenoylcysteine decarboxylase/phosphopantothenate--cysteine ligase